MIFVNHVVLKKLWKPFYTFLNQLKSFRLGTPQNPPHTPTNITEFIDLQTAVNALLKANIQVFEQQKQFIENASHELQTPLAIATHKLELLLENKDIKSEEAESIAEIYNSIQRLVRLNKSLLLLTKIENKQFMDSQTVSINKIVWQCVNDLEDFIAFKHLKIYRNETSELQTEMDVSLAHILISNLIRNAVFHTLEQGEIEITLSAASLKISNRGPHKALDKNLIFTRFYKAGTKTHSSGLGLAIAKAIADRYGITLQYTFENKLHCFTLHFSTS